MKNTAILFQAVEAARERILAAERHLWANPESGYREWKTHAYMLQQFTLLGYTITEAGNIPGFYVDVDTGRPGPTLGIFAEMDALIIPSHPESDPDTGAVHACGHHCQCAAMLGIAAALKAPGALEGLCGRIRLIVVPAEELIEIRFRHELKAQGIIRYCGGKQEFMYRGYLDNVDLSMMVHTSSSGIYGANRGSNGCVIKEAAFTGKSAHAGGSPHMGVNALYAANCGMQVANALRETFRDEDHIRFHPIITQGGDVVNAIPDCVTVESYVRGASMEAIARESEKINRAFAGAAAAMGCGLQLKDEHGYAPRNNDALMRDAFYQTGTLLFAEEDMTFTEDWGTGCSDMGDVSCIMPAVHPYIGGAQGQSHGSQFRITDPVLACVTSAKVQCGVAAYLLANGAEKANEIVAGFTGRFQSPGAYLAWVDQTCFEGECVSYNDDGTITLTYKN